MKAFPISFFFQIITDMRQHHNRMGAPLSGAVSGQVTGFMYDFVHTGLVDLTHNDGHGHRIVLFVLFIAQQIFPTLLSQDLITGLAGRIGGDAVGISA